MSSQDYTEGLCLTWQWILLTLSQRGNNGGIWHLWWTVGFGTTLPLPYMHVCMLSHSAAAAAKSLQSCLALWDAIASSPPGSPIPGILQARTLEWVAISFSSAWKWKVKVKLHSRVQPSETPWTAAYQAPPSVGFSRQEYWSGVPLPSPIQIIGEG